MYLFISLKKPKYTDIASEKKITFPLKKVTTIS